MSNSSGIIRITVSSFLVLTIMLYYSFSLVSGNDFPLKSSGASLTVSDKKSGKTDIKKEDATKGEEKKVEKSEEAPKYIEVAASGNVLGKISEKFITPYTANTSYKNIYLKNSTGLNINLEDIYKEKLGFKIEKNKGPQVLIVHTHATESFIFHSESYYTDTDLTRTTDLNKNMTAIGAVVAKKLNDAGIETLHDKTLHDYPSYNESYARSAETIKNYLKKYPSIKVVLDLHRDAIASEETGKIKPVTEINGKKAAQVMLVMGSESGSVNNFPHWRENLKLAVKFQERLESLYPTLARSVSFVSRTYNENLTTGSMLLEMGTDANNFSEVLYSAELVGNTLVELLGE